MRAVELVKRWVLCFHQGAFQGSSGPTVLVRMLEGLSYEEVLPMEHVGLRAYRKLNQKRRLEEAHKALVSLGISEVDA
jgi:hypothetical protein